MLSSSRLPPHVLHGTPLWEGVVPNPFCLAEPAFNYSDRTYLLISKGCQEEALAMLIKYHSEGGANDPVALF
ncbi:general substrate transporter [Penicillium fimorum]|uniref:General substrate transporter n=1 Tax=Penicillium fimorum TaxID=1882269 RepID=A0A9W9Y672_9EURO|nr:general substrate transporter [Penicillium fimorum]